MTPIRPNIVASGTYALGGSPWSAVMPRNNEGMEATLQDSVSISPAPATETAPMDATSIESLQKTTMTVGLQAASTHCPIIRLILLGAEKSCKKDGAKMLAEEFEVPHLHMGDLIKKEIASGSRLGHKIQNAIEKGNKSPCELLQMLKQRLSQDDVQNGFILDAYPSDLAPKEAEFLTRNLQDLRIVEINDSTGKSTCPTAIPAVEALRERGEYYSVDDSGDPQEVNNVLGALAMNFQAPQINFLRA